MPDGWLALIMEQQQLLYIRPMKKELKYMFGLMKPDLETRALKYSMGRADAIEGGMAYFEKRPPQWSANVSADWPDWMDE